MNPAVLMFVGSTLLTSPVLGSGAAAITPDQLQTNAPVVTIAAPPEEAAAQGGGRSGGSTPITWRGQAGLFFVGGDTGFILGGGGGARPFSNKQIEATGDLHFARISGYNGIYGSGNGLYHFNTSSTQVAPFAGAGLGISHFSNDTQVRLQILGGLDFNQKSEHPLRVDVRFFFTDGDSTTILTLGMGFGQK